MKTNYDNLIRMNKEQLADFLNKYTTLDNTPWGDWFANTYCSKCESIRLSRKEYGKIFGCSGYRDFIDCSYCEVKRGCRFFTDSEDVPDTKDIILMWLESEPYE